MTFTAFGLARIKTPEFLQALQQLPQGDEAFLFLVMTACADEHGEVVLSSYDDFFDFVDTHHKQLVDMMMQAQSAIIAMQRWMFTQSSC